MVPADAPLVLVFRSPVFAPSETFVQAQAAELTRYRAIVLGCDDRGPARPELEGRILLPRSRLERLAFRLGRTAPAARRLAPLRPALVHAHFAPDGLMVLPLARRLRVPLVTSLRGYDLALSRAAMLRSGSIPRIRYALRGERLRRKGDLFLAVSDWMRRRAVALGFPEGRTRVHYNGVDLSIFRPPPQPPAERIVLHVGRLVEKKGTSDLLAAFARIAARQPDARLRIVGEGPLAPTLAAQAQGLGLAPRIEWLGAQPQETVAALMRSAWLLAAPSRTAADGDSEGLPNVVVEAAASGLPVVAADHAGTSEAVVEGRTGWLVPERDVAALAERMASLLGDADARAAMAAAARHGAEGRFDRRVQMERLEALYDGLTGRPAPRRDGLAEGVDA